MMSDQTPADYFVDNYTAALRVAMQETVRSGREHGFLAVAGSVEAPPEPTVISGVAGGVDIPELPAATPVGFSVHTHPPGSPFLLSVEDWERLWVDLFARVDEHRHPEETHRGFVTLATDPGSPGRQTVDVSVKWVTPEGLSLGRGRRVSLEEEYRDLVNAADTGRDLAPKVERLLEGLLRWDLREVPLR